MNRVLALAVCLALPLSALAQITPSKESLSGLYPGKTYSPYAERSFPDTVYWGDTHLHTSYSMDAGAFGNRLDPEEAYRHVRRAGSLEQRELAVLRELAAWRETEAERVDELLRSGLVQRLYQKNHEDGGPIEEILSSILTALQEHCRPDTVYSTDSGANGPPAGPEAVSPVVSATCRLIERAMSTGSPNSAALAVTSRNASSSDRPSTSGVNSLKTEKICRDTAW